jgi:[protein-PII] uridylyltransferase
VWNAWKGKLLEDLFRLTRRLLRGETDYASSWIAAKKDEALRIFRQYVPEEGPPRGPVETSRRQLLPALRGGGDRLAHARSLGESTPDKPIVRARLSPVGEGLQVLVYAPDEPGLFARITSFFERLQFDVVAAKIYTTEHGFRARQLPGAAEGARRRALPRDQPEGRDEARRAYRHPRPDRSARPRAVSRAG